MIEFVLYMLEQVLASAFPGMGLQCCRKLAVAKRQDMRFQNTISVYTCKQQTKELSCPVCLHAACTCLSFCHALVSCLFKIIPQCLMKLQVSR